MIYISGPGHGGQAMISNNYLEYAKRISPDGKPGGDWESNRTEILSELTGSLNVSVSKTEAAPATPADSSGETPPATSETQEVPQNEPLPIPNTPPQSPPQLG